MQIIHLEQETYLRWPKTRPPWMVVTKLTNQIKDGAG